DRKSTRLNSSHDQISYAVFCLKKKKQMLAVSARQNIRHDEQQVMPKSHDAGVGDGFGQVRIEMRCAAVYRLVFFFFFNDTATTEIYTLSLHDALPISSPNGAGAVVIGNPTISTLGTNTARSEEHTSELQSRSDLVCRLLLEKKKK